jgi:hypothetical protein
MAYIAIVAMVEKTKQIKHITAKDCLGSGSGGCMHQGNCNRASFEENLLGRVNRKAFNTRSQGICSVGP